MTEEIKKLRFEAAIGYAKIVDDTLKDYSIDSLSEFIGINKKEYNYKLVNKGQSLKKLTFIFYGNNTKKPSPF